MRDGLPLTKIRNGEKLFLKVCQMPKCGLADYYSGSVIRCPECEGAVKYAPKPKRANKYHAVRSIDSEGRAYPSRLERDRGQQLVLMQKAGEISELTFQCGVDLLNTPLGVIKYKPDFSYVEDGQQYWGESKGCAGERWRIIRKLWSVFGPGPLRVTKRSRNKGIRIVETIWPEPLTIDQLDMPDSAIHAETTTTDRSARG